MKRLVFFALLIGLSSCEFYYFQPAVQERDQILGRYSVDEYSETYNDHVYYSIWIEPSGRYSNEFYIENFYGVDISVCASISYGKITIHRQIVEGYEIEGVGTVYANEIEFQYSVKDLYTGTRTDFCEATAWENY